MSQRRHSESLAWVMLHLEDMVVCRNHFVIPKPYLFTRPLDVANNCLLCLQYTPPLKTALFKRISSYW
jgi:hypothetical protein